MKSVSIKLWSLMLALVFVALALLWLFQIVFLEQYYFSALEKKLLREGNSLVRMLQQDWAQYTIETKLEELLLKYNARIDLYTTTGVIMYSSEASPKAASGDKNAVLTKVINDRKAISTIRQGSMQSNLLIVGLPVISSDMVTAAVIMTIPVASVKETVDTLKEQLMIISVILIAVSAILAYIFSRYFTRPILEINQAAKTMSEGNLSVKLPVNSSDELGMLAGTINHLSTQLQKIEQLRKELIANVSHEFRTPLSLIKGYAETIRDVKTISEEKRGRQLDIIIEEADKLNGMINDILDLSQIQSQYFILEKSDFNINDVIQSVVGRLSFHAENKGATIQWSHQGELMVNADERRLEQVIYNLLNNAIIHSGKDGSIFIHAKDKGDSIFVEIQDEGEGIPTDSIPYIWDRFYKASKSSSNTNKGSGLGLAIVKSILEAHEASFGVESQPGRGSKFWFEVQRGAQNPA